LQNYILNKVSQYNIKVSDELMLIYEVCMMLLLKQGSAETGRG